MQDFNYIFLIFNTMTTKREDLTWPSVQEMMLGTEPIWVSGNTPYNFADGKAAYGVVCRLDDTQITSITTIDGDVITDKTWQSVNMKAGVDCIVFDTPIISITLNTAGSVALYPVKQRQP
jgi:hypothetical protein